MEKELLPNSIDIHYTRISSYRVYHVDGIYGGRTPDGKYLTFDLFRHRNPSPTLVSHEIDESGKLGKVIDMVVRGGMSREIEAGLVIDFEVANMIRDWLNERISEWERKEEERE